MPDAIGTSYTLRFIHAKNDQTSLVNFNISVNVTDKFLDAVDNDQLLLEAFLCRHAKQLLGVSFRKSRSFVPSNVCNPQVLEADIAGSANWKLNLAESSKEPVALQKGAIPDQDWQSWGIVTVRKRWQQ